MALSPTNVFAHRVRNAVQTGVLLLAMAAWTGLLGWILAGAWGLFTGLAVAVIAVAAAGRANPWLVLRMYGASPLDAAQAPGLYRVVGALARKARLPKLPRLFYIPSPIPNAVSMGSRNHPAIAVTDGLVRRLDDRETVAVLAHELSHIANGDLTVMAIADSFARYSGLLGQMGMLLLVMGMCLFQPGWLGPALVLALGPTLSTLLMLGLSRQREFAADLSAVQLTGDPDALASALARIEQPQNLMEQMIGVPGRDLNPSLLRTHPATEQRVERLRQLSMPERRVRPPERPFLDLPPVERPAARTWWGAWH